MNTSNKPALVLFTKAPNDGKAKSRLAKSIGGQKALNIHNILLEHTINTCHQASSHFDLFVSLPSEKPTDLSHFAGFSAAFSRHQDLKCKVSDITNTLLKNHKMVVVIGSDTPSLSVETLMKVIEESENYDHILGPADDGGFYLFATKSPIDQTAWKQTLWSQSDTLDQISNLLDKKRTFRLGSLPDIDCQSDLLKYLSQENKRPNSRRLPLVKLLQDTLENSSI